MLKWALGILLIFFYPCISDAQEVYQYKDYAYNSYFDVYDSKQGLLKINGDSGTNYYSPVDVTYKCGSADLLCIHTPPLSFSVPSCKRGELDISKWKSGEKVYQVVSRVTVSVFGKSIDAYLIKSSSAFVFNDDMGMSSIAVGKSYNVVDSFYYSCENGLIAFGYSFPDMLDMGRMYWLQNEEGFAAQSDK